MSKINVHPFIKKYFIAKKCQPSSEPSANHNLPVGGESSLQCVNTQNPRRSIKRSTVRRGVCVRAKRRKPSRSKYSHTCAPNDSASKYTKQRLAEPRAEMANPPLRSGTQTVHAQQRRGARRTASSGTDVRASVVINTHNALHPQKQSERSPSTRGPVTETDLAWTINQTIAN